MRVETKVMTQNTHKIEIAMEYLDTAAVLWLQNSKPFSSLHLAGAAEELSGKMCRIMKINSEFDEIKLLLKRIIKDFNLPHTEKDIRNLAYEAKNSVKHMDSRTSANVNINAREEASHLIQSAFNNFKKLGLDDMLSGAVHAVIEENAIYIEIDD